MSDPDHEDGESSSEEHAQRPSRQFRPPLLAPHERYPDDLVVDRVQLARSMDEHLDVLKAILSRDLYPLDLYMSGALQRSYHLVEGFLLAWDHWNVIVAAPLVRFQIDSLVRCAYLCQRGDSDAVVIEVLGGTALRDLKDAASGKKLTDAHLVELAGALYDWLPPVYVVSNEWVHLSERHIFNAWQHGDGRTLLGQFPMPTDDIPVRFWQELIGAMCHTTGSLLALGSGWAAYKISDEHAANMAATTESASAPPSPSGAG
jgi:hypothetical protein